MHSVCKPNLDASTLDGLCSSKTPWQAISPEKCESFDRHGVDESPLDEPQGISNATVCLTKYGMLRGGSS